MPGGPPATHWNELGVGEHKQGSGLTLFYLVEQALHSLDLKSSAVSVTRLQHLLLGYAPGLRGN